jgi:hypothetical protein
MEYDLNIKYWVAIINRTPYLGLFVKVPDHGY